MAKSPLNAPRHAVLLLALTCGTGLAADNHKPAALVDKTGLASERAEIAARVRALGARTFAARQQAQRALVDYGIKARDALEAACHDPDQEVQRRAKAALDAVNDVDFYVRLEKFRADQDFAAGHGLAGWDRFRACAGSSGPARRLFAEMQRAERGLLEMVERAPRPAGTLLDARCQQVHVAVEGDEADRQTAMSLASMAAIVFAASEANVPVSRHAGDCINGFPRQTAFSRALNAKPLAPVMRGLLGNWVGREFERASIVSYRNQIMAMQYNLKEAIAPALALIEPPGGQPHLEQYAILAIGKLGGREQAPALLPLLDDSRPVGVPNRTGQDSDAQIRDVALAALLHLTGQKLSDYGFDHAKSNALILFNANTLGFNDPSAREQALAKWRSWWERERAP